MGPENHRGSPPFHRQLELPESVAEELGERKGLSRLSGMPANRRAGERQNGSRLSRPHSPSTAGGRVRHAGVHAEISTAQKRADARRGVFGKEFDLRKANIDYWSRAGAEGLREPECGSFYLHIDVWYRKSPWIASTGPDGKEFIEYLTNFGGISIFRDEINIFPAEWGAETDWLNLSKRHIKQGFRMSYYNMIGNLEINQATNIELIDKTNREGLIANRASKDLTQLVHAIVSTVIETEFIAKRDEYDELTGRRRCATRRR